MNTRDPPIKVKPKIFSKEWWHSLGSAAKVWEYDARDCAIWTLSGWQTTAFIFGLFKPVAEWITATMPWLVNGLLATKSVVATSVSTGWSYVTAFAVAVWNICSP